MESYWDALTSSTCPTNRESFVNFNGGSFQLLTSYHHRRTLLPSVLPLNEALRFQYRHPERARVQRVPWTNGRMTYTGYY